MCVYIYIYIYIYIYTHTHICVRACVCVCVRVFSKPCSKNHCLSFPPKLQKFSKLQINSIFYLRVLTSRDNSTISQTPLSCLFDDNLLLTFSTKVSFHPIFHGKSPVEISTEVWEGTEDGKVSFQKALTINCSTSYKGPNYKGVQISFFIVVEKRLGQLPVSSYKLRLFAAVNSARDDDFISNSTTEMPRRT